MKKIFYILILFAVKLHAQTHKMPADTEFFYTYGGTNIDEARDIKETADKGYILAGTTGSFGQGAASVYMIKTDSLGNHKWSAVFGGAQNDHAYAIELTYDSGFFVAGYSNSFSSDYAAYYLKTDASGNLLWQKYIDNGANSFIYGACPVVADSGYILCGQTYATTDFTSDAFLIRVNKNGDTLWTRHYGDSLDEAFNSVCIINNKIYAVGSSGSHAGADSLADGWIIKTDMNGNKLQETFVSFGAKQQETLNGITPYNDTLFTVCGADNHIDSNATIPIILKYDTSLNININIASLNGLTIDSTVRGYLVLFNKVVNISYGSICLVGYAKGGLGGTNMFFMGFDRNGIIINNYDYLRHSGGTFNDYGYSAILTTGGKLISVGSTQGFSGMPSPPYCANPKMGLDDVFLVRFDSDSISNSALTAQPLTSSPRVNCFADSLFLWQASIKNYNTNYTLNLFPNPINTNAQLEIKCNAKNIYTAHVLSVLGNEVRSFKVYSNQSNQLDFSSLSEGTYFIKLQDDTQQNTSVIKFIISR